MTYSQPDFFRFGTDSLWLVEIVKQTLHFRPKHICELGAGCGVISCELAQSFDEAQFFCVELQKAFRPFLNENLNQYIKDRYELRMQAVQDFNLDDEEKFDLIIFNPPYFSSSMTRPSPTLEREMSRKHVVGNWQDWQECVQRSLADKGAVYWVDRSDRVMGKDFVTTKIAELGELRLFCASRLDIK